MNARSEALSCDHIVSSSILVFHGLCYGTIHVRSVAKLRVELPQSLTKKNLSFFWHIGRDKIAPIHLKAVTFSRIQGVQNENDIKSKISKMIT